MFFRHNPYAGPIFSQPSYLVRLRRNADLILVTVITTSFIGLVVSTSSGAARSMIAVCRYILLAALTAYAARGISTVKRIVKVRRHVARLIGGIPPGSARRLLKIEWHRVGAFGRGHRRRAVARLVLNILVCSVTWVLAWAQQSPIWLLVAVSASLHVLAATTYTTTPPTVLYLAPSDVATHFAHWMLGEAIEALGGYRTVAFLDTGVLDPAEVLPAVQDVSIRLDDAEGGDWYAAVYWLVEVVPFIVVDLRGGKTDLIELEANMLCGRGLTSKTFFLVHDDEREPLEQKSGTPVSSTLERTLRKRLQAEQFRFVSQARLTGALVAMLMDTAKSGIIQDIRVNPNRTDLFAPDST